MSEIKGCLENISTCVMWSKKFMIMHNEEEIFFIYNAYYLEQTCPFAKLTSICDDETAMAFRKAGYELTRHMEPAHTVS
jgi:hypothetical protein